jgi:regulator of cell morphogenesis and NO signaling
MTESMMSNEAVMQMSVNEAIRRFPATVEIFNRYGIDACCGGAAPVVEAAIRDGADPVALQAELLRVVGEAA